MRRYLTAVWLPLILAGATLGPRPTPTPTPQGTPHGVQSTPTSPAVDVREGTLPPPACTPIPTPWEVAPACTWTDVGQVREAYSPTTGAWMRVVAAGLQTVVVMLEYEGEPATLMFARSGDTIESVYPLAAVGMRAKRSAQYVVHYPAWIQANVANTVGLFRDADGLPLVWVEFPPPLRCEGQREAS
jgi:hypothetical protein